MVRLDSDDRERVARELQAARESRVAMDPPTLRWPLMDVTDAYSIQDAGVAVRLKGGSRLTGWKVGLTSAAAQEQLSVSEPDFAPLLNDMAAISRDEVPLDQLIAPRVEAEFAFIMANDLFGIDVTPEDVVRATSRVIPAIEIVDSRIKDWRVTLADTVADHASGGLYVLGGPGDSFTEEELRDEWLSLSLDGEPLEAGQGGAVLGNPAAAVAWLASKLAPRGQGLRPGDVVLAGAVHRPVPITSSCKVEVVSKKFGAVSIHFA